MRLTVLIVATLIASMPALAHSWYPLACCGNMDCFPVACDQLVETVSGWLYVPTGNEVSCPLARRVLMFFLSVTCPPKVQCYAMATRLFAPSR